MSNLNINLDVLPFFQALYGKNEANIFDSLVENKTIEKSIERASNSIAYCLNAERKSLSQSTKCSGMSLTLFELNIVLKIVANMLIHHAKVTKKPLINVSGAFFEMVCDATDKMEEHL